MYKVFLPPPKLPQFAPLVHSGPRWVQRYQDLQCLLTENKDDITKEAARNLFRINKLNI